ncbi:MAG: 50S ribosomal protein L6 [Alphaproteobacteria bacterium]|jgi:large subunit ribosomal protein L6|nr:50S ribosomal protein L6 [Alphaproteobacteria bacterium]
MSRVGKYPVVIPAGVELSINNNTVTAKGKFGELSYAFDDSHVSTKVEDGKVTVSPLSQSNMARALWGTTRARINDLIKGVSEGFTKEMELVGVGYKARVEGKKLVLSLGFSHDVLFEAPEGIKISCASPTQITIFGADKQTVGQVAAEIRKYRKPEPYKGKGVKYVNEYVRRKEGKKK